MLHALVVAWLVCAGPPAPAAPPSGHYLVWSDEFNGTSLDTTKWGHWLLGNRRDAINVTNAISMDGSNLVITTYTSGGIHYTGMIATDGKFRPKFGYFEASIDWSDSAGMWSAFWLQSSTMGADINDPQTSGSEIDIAEHRLIDGSSNNISGQVQANIHWNGYGADHVSVGSGNVGSGLNSGFHTYGFRWTPTSYSFTIDGSTTWNGGSAPVSRSTEWIILSSEVENNSWAGGIPPGGYGSLASSTTRMRVDYVRYYAPTTTVFWAGDLSTHWTNAGNWIDNRRPFSSSDVVFGSLSDANLATSLATNHTIRSLTVLDTDTSFVLGGTNTLTLGIGGIDMLSLSKSATVNCPLSLSSTQGWAVGGSQTFTVNNTLDGSTPLYKTGTGRVQLGVSNGYTGTVVVRAGSFGFSPGTTSSAPVVVTSNGAFHLIGGTTNITLTSLTLTNADLNISYGTLTNVPPSTAAFTTLRIVGTNTVNISGTGLPVGSITLLTYGSTNGGGRFVLGTLPSRVVATLTNVGSALVLNVTSSPQLLTWLGSASGIWSTNATLDWNPGPVRYSEYPPATNAVGDLVTFNDTGADTSVTIGQTVRPSSLVVSNDALAYSFNGSGRIAGAVGLTKRGTNILTINNTNQYSGNTVVDEGILSVGSSGALYSFTGGDNITIRSGGTLVLRGDIGWQSRALGWLDVTAAGIVLDGGKLAHIGTGNAATSDGAGHLFTIGSSGAILESQTAGQSFVIGYRYDYSSTLTSSSGGALTLTGVGDGDLNYGLPGTGRLVKSGSGEWTVSGSSSFTGNAEIREGTLLVRHARGLGSTAGITYISNGASVAIASGVVVTSETARVSGPGADGIFGALRGASTGNNEWDGPVVITSTGTRIGAETNAVLIVSGPISEASPGTELTLRSAPGAVVALANANNAWTGDSFLIGSGTTSVIRTDIDQAFPAASPIGIGNVVLDLNGHDLACAGVLKGFVSAVDAQCLVENDGAQPATLTLAPAVSTTFPGTLRDGSSTLALVVSGPATQTFTGTNTHTGPTVINGGTLAVMGSFGTSPVTIENGGTLSGTGLLRGTVAVLGGGTLSPGGSAIGQMRISNSLTMLPVSTTRVTVDRSTASSDRIKVFGTVAYGGVLAVTNLAGTLAPGDSFTIVEASSATGTFAGISGSPGPGLSWSFNPASGVLSVVNGAPAQPGPYRLALAATNHPWPGALTNFPMLVVLGTNIPGFSYSQFAATNGSDLRFSTPDLLSPLNFEVETWNPSGESRVWVQVPLFSNQCAIVASWGAGNSTNPPPSLTNGATWSGGYVAVWHLASTLARDASANAHDASSNTATLTTGIVGSGLFYDGITNQTIVPHHTNLNLPGPFEVQGWFRMNPADKPAVNQFRVLTSRQLDLTNRNWWVSIRSDGRLWWKSSDGIDITNATDLADGGWHSFSLVHDTTNARLSIDGSAVVTDTTPGLADTPVAPLYFGCEQGSARFHRGPLDEMRLSRVARSEAWVWAVHHNIASHASFLSYGTVTNTSPNQAPTLNPVGDRMIDPGVVLLITNTATDLDVPAQSLSFSLTQFPPGAAVNSTSGVFTWRPPVASAMSSNPVTVVVFDSGMPPLSATQSFVIRVSPLSPASIGSLGMSNGVFTFSVQGPAGPDYTIQASSNLMDWIPLFATNSPTPPFQWSDTNAGSHIRRFYRTLLGP